MKGSLSCFFVACVLASTFIGSIVRYRSDDKRGSSPPFKWSFSEGYGEYCAYTTAVDCRCQPSQRQIHRHIALSFRTVCTYIILLSTLRSEQHLFSSLSLWSCSRSYLSIPPFPPPLLHFSGAIMPSSMALRREDNNSPNTLTLPYLLYVH